MWYRKSGRAFARWSCKSAELEVTLGRVFLFVDVFATFKGTSNKRQKKKKKKEGKKAFYSLMLLKLTLLQKKRE